MSDCQSDWLVFLNKADKLIKYILLSNYLIMKESCPHAHKWLVLAVALSIVAIAASLYAGFNANKCKTTLADEDTFNAKVETGIQAYIKKQQEAAQPPAAPTEPVEVSIDDDPIKGDVDAPVTIIEFSEYECPYCKKYVDETLNQINEKYIKTGKVKYVFRDFPLGFHQHAKPAAMAAECVRDEDGDEAYWEYHDTLFANRTALDNDNLKKYASDMGIDIADCLDNEDFAEEVEKDMADGQKYGVRGTPAFFINGRLVSGAQPFANFEKVIEEELSK